MFGSELVVAGRVGRSELIGLKWLDVNFNELELSVIRSVCRQRIGRFKTEIPMSPSRLIPGGLVVSDRRYGRHEETRTPDLYHVKTST